MLEVLLQTPEVRRKRHIFPKSLAILTLRDATEWVEAVEIGWNQLIHPLTMNLCEIVTSSHDVPYVEGLYGNGKASEKITDFIKQYLA